MELFEEQPKQEDAGALMPRHTVEAIVAQRDAALRELKPDGYLVAIMSAGTEFRETKKSITFRELVLSLKGRIEELPAGSFAESGTNVNTVTVRLWKNGTPINRW